MIFARPNFLKAFLFVAAALPASAAELERVEARFEIFGFAGLHVLTNRTTVQERGDRYAIATDLETRGLASVFVDLTRLRRRRPRVDQDPGQAGKEAGRFIWYAPSKPSSCAPKGKAHDATDEGQTVACAGTSADRRPPGSHMTRRWRELDSNPRSPV